MRYEVRCCCIPQKLLGYLHAPNNVSEWRWAVKQSMPWTRILHADQMTTPITHIKLPIALIYLGERCYPAIKAEGVEIDTLRNIVGFEEAMPTSPSRR